MSRRRCKASVIERPDTPDARERIAKASRVLSVLDQLDRTPLETAPASRMDSGWKPNRKPAP